jgi:ribose 5-phosphate isomerase B
MDSQAYVLALGADQAGVELKNALRERLRTDPRVVIQDYGVADGADTTDYPHIGLTVAEAIANGTVRRAVLICGTGIGMAIAANKVPGIRATVAHDPYSVERSIKSNNCQILTLGARVIGVDLAYTLVSAWIGYEFDPASASARKVDAIAAYEARTARTLSSPLAPCD